jgi:hypothetical protein
MMTSTCGDLAVSHLQSLTFLLIELPPCRATAAALRHGKVTSCQNADSTDEYTEQPLSHARVV